MLVVKSHILWKFSLEGWQQGLHTDVLIWKWGPLTAWLMRTLTS